MPLLSCFSTLALGNMFELAPLAIVYALVGALFLDWKTVGVMYTIKTYRLLTLWIIVYAIEKVFLENYMRRVYINREPAPSFTQLVTVSWAIEFIALTVPLLIVSLLYVRYKAADNAFVIDRDIIKGILADYMMSSALMVLVGIAIVNQIQDNSLFRYDHDGLRAIRAGSQIFFQCSAIILFVPFYSIAD